ncbi:MAG: ferredoxin [Caldiserica bacterium]|nr:MAG: ferredoxin [Caldisericota bacterium]
MSVEKDGLISACKIALISARTAPKARGTDNIVFKLISEKNEILKISEKMKEIGNSGYKTKTFLRDSENIKNADALILIGTKKQVMGLDCGFCGFNSCRELEEKGGVCAYNSGDLGIAIGSLVAKLSDFRIDNRIMYTVGYAVLKMGLLGEEVKIAYGIPVKVSGKNIFFDRK